MNAKTNKTIIDNDEPAFEVDRDDAIEISSYQTNFACNNGKYGNVTKEFLLALAGNTYTLGGEKFLLPSKESVAEDIDNFVFYNAIFRDYTDSAETTLSQEDFYREITPEFKKYLASRNITLTYYYPHRKDLKIRPQNMFVKTPNLDIILGVLGFDLAENKRLVTKEGKSFLERSPEVIIRSTSQPSKGYSTYVIAGLLRKDFAFKHIYEAGLNGSSEGLLKCDPAPYKLIDLSDLAFDVEGM